MYYRNARCWHLLFVHGQDGNKEEAEVFSEIAVPAGYVVPELQDVAAHMKSRWKRISIRVNSIGSYFSMLALGNESIDKALFVSPIVDMERLIIDMIGWAGVSEELLRAKGKILANFGQTLSWKYLCWVREHPLSGWCSPTAILYAGQDNLTSRQTVEDFAKEHNTAFEIYEPGEHWFHTPEQLKVLQEWEVRNIWKESQYIVRSQRN